MKVKTFIKKYKYVLYLTLFIGVIFILDSIFSNDKVLSCKYKEGLKNPDNKTKKEKCKNCPKGSCVNGKCVKKSGFQNNVPSSSPSKVKNDVDLEINTVSKIEDAFDNIKTLLGDESLSKMSEHSKDMVAQQKELLNIVNSMGPNIKNASKFLNKLNLPNISVFSNLMKKIL